MTLNITMQHSSEWHADEHHAWYMWMAHMVGQVEHLPYHILVKESCKSWQQVYHTLYHLNTSSLDPQKCVDEVAKCVPMVGNDQNWKHGKT